MYLARTPRLLQALMPAYTWRMPTYEKVLHLTFDDGPIPEVTPWVLDVLAEYRARATFFCVGENVQRYPNLFHRLTAEGHAVGNHTHNHLNGWETDNLTYFHNVRHCARVVRSNLFRPPYGRVTPSQRQFLQRHYRIVMWDVLSGDFDPNISAEQCLHNVLEHTQRGSIIVMHDSLKAEYKLRYVLPRLLDHFTGLGYRFEAISGQKQTRPSFQLRAAHS
jgi:peptidoglycan-N-acetylglucosamine deacetylase